MELDKDIVAAVTAAPVAALTAAMIANVDFDMFATGGIRLLLRSQGEYESKLVRREKSEQVTECCELRRKDGRDADDRSVLTRSA